jgi:hypothetical protein
MDLTNAAWRTSSLSANGGNSCVQVASDLPDRRVAVRDSKDRRGAVLVFTAAEWTAFTSAVRGGEFDLA